MVLAVLGQRVGARLADHDVYVATVGGAPLGIIKQYVANQRNA